MTEWSRRYSGWESDFRGAGDRLSARSETLLELVGRSVAAGWTVWDHRRERSLLIGPLVLVLSDGSQVEIAWDGWNDLSLTRDTVDLTTPAQVLGGAWTWRPSEPQPVAVIAGRTITGFAAVETPYFDGGEDLSELPLERAKGWLADGLWIEFGDIGLHVYNSADDNGYSSSPYLKVHEGATRVTRLG
ncbi:hypothetical protein Ait01nite_034230 [Actinoplanes italicus]|uniref:Uncharacterized protein n=1 Tax=Actinoplanes italicus TaxID=113567 RepID=A0A2T0K3M1_9ACTN|nr:hypothetical protein [Actinoplanes italicus]PRX17452.1 hypothetical protein CLV67_116228 [Actinoplanes italicus]GIE30378.1 hypothetical protein Ait01nite_034230 [Actinoplanes italicus]